MRKIKGHQDKGTIRIAKPFLKWAGGKQRLLSKYELFFPDKIRRYFEPFVGGGAVFFYLWSAGRLSEKIFLFDSNQELINTYLAVKKHLDELCELLMKYKRSHNIDFFYKMRELDRQKISLSSVEKAARTIYLNKTCYNGLYRVNQKGHFNVPIGRYEDPNIFDKETLINANISLQNVALEVKDFNDTFELAQEGDFIYFDPPYHPLNKTSKFTNYQSKGFYEEDQYNLAELFKSLTGKGCLCMLSNSKTPFILELYKDFKTEFLSVTRSINSNAAKRAGIEEVIVLNY